MYRCLESRHKARIEGICELLGLGEFIRSLPNGLSTKLEEGGNNLSGDQRQRLAGQSLRSPVRGRCLRGEFARSLERALLAARRQAPAQARAKHLRSRHSLHHLSGLLLKLVNPWWARTET